MKIKAKLVYDSHERVFFIPCGAGDKSFKWLGMVASSRYSTAAPNGHLRRREELCAISERAQYQATSIILASGESPHPNETLNEYLREGDEVTIQLCNTLNIDGETGTPAPSMWGSMAYSTSAVNINPYMSGSLDSMDSEDENADERASTREANLISKSNAEFMRIVLASQMINTKAVANVVKTKWSPVAKHIPLLTDNESVLVEQIFAANWGKLLDLFANYAPEGNMNREEFLTFMEDSDVFKVINAKALAVRIYTKTCKLLNVDHTSFDLSSLLVALLLCAQAKYNDTLVKNNKCKNSYDALNELFTLNFVPLARRLQLASVLKDDFVSDECLSKLRAFYTELQVIFDKHAAKYRDIPTTIPLNDLTELLKGCQLIDAKETHRVKIWHDEVRNGRLTFGREADVAPEAEAEPLLTSELTFPEFIEVIARAGYVKFYNHEVGAELNDSDPSIIDCFLKGCGQAADGVQPVSKTATAKNKKK